MFESPFAYPNVYAEIIEMKAKALAKSNPLPHKPAKRWREQPALTELSLRRS